MAKRECKVILCAGKKGVGKTVETIRMIDNYVRGNPAQGRPPRKSLLFDVNNEFEDFWFFQYPHRKIRSIRLADIELFSSHKTVDVRRIRPFWDDGRRMSIDDMGNALEIILDKFRNGLLLIEDINKYTADTMKKDLVGLLATARHVGIDVICHFQGVGRLGNPKLLMNSDYIRLHKTVDTVSRNAHKFMEHSEILEIAENIVNTKFEAGDERFFIYVDTGKSKIQRGNYDESDIQKALSDYIDTYYTSLVGRELKRRDQNTGAPIYKYGGQAAISIKQKLYKKYFQ